MPRLSVLAFLVPMMAASFGASTARADTGHVGLLGGVSTLEEGSDTTWRPYVRTEIAFRLFGPFELGGFLQVATLSLPAELPSFGGGLLFELRPDVSLFGFVPHAEIAGSRVSLPTGEGRLDAWGLSVGGGLGYEAGVGVVIEARLHHNWYFDLPSESAVRTDGWTLTAGVTYRLP